jgi:hypothetical protein
LTRVNKYGTKALEQTRYGIEIALFGVFSTMPQGSKEFTMIAFAVATLIFLVALATTLALADFWLRARSAYASLRRQTQLMKAGFVPQVDAKVVRLRSATVSTGCGTSRSFATRLPRHQPALRAPGAA